MRTVDLEILVHHAVELLADIERDREPILVTHRGLPGAYLVDVDTWALIEARLSMLEGIVRGERALAGGCVATDAQARERLGKQLAARGNPDGD